MINCKYGYKREGKPTVGLGSFIRSKDDEVNNVYACLEALTRLYLTGGLSLKTGNKNRNWLKNFIS